MSGADAFAHKSTVDQIRARFDADVERFSSLDTGQAVVIDATLHLDLVSEAAAASTSPINDILDVGCGAGNFSIKLLRRLRGESRPLPDVNVTLVDLSRPMLERAEQRVRAETAGRVTVLQGDIREVTLPEFGHDVVLAAAVLHHLRGDDEWQSVFASLHATLRPGGGLWIVDQVDACGDVPRDIARRQYAEHLERLDGPALRDKVFAYIEKEDTPRPLSWQLSLLERSGFAMSDVLHKHGPFASFGAIRP